jgi:hypothetical protein
MKSLICVLLILAILAGFGYLVVNSVVAETEIVSKTTEIVAAEVTHADCSQRYSSTRGTVTTYRLSLQWDDNAEVIVVDAKTYAKYKVGDVVQLSITTYERKNGHTNTTYNIG